MRTFLKTFKAYNKQFIIFQVFNIFMVVLLRVTVDIKVYSYSIGFMTSIVLLISLIVYDYPNTPIKFKDLMKALVIGYIFYDLVYVIGFLSFGFSEFNEGIVGFSLFHTFTIYCYFIYFSQFRSKNASVQYYFEDKLKDEPTAKDYINNILRLTVLIIFIGILKYNFSDFELSSNSWKIIIYMAIAVMIVFKLKFILSPFINSYKKLVDHDN